MRSNKRTKKLRKTIIDRSKLSNKTTPEESKKHFNLKRNFCVSFFLKTKRGISAKADHKVVSDNRTFGRTIGPLFLEKASHKEAIILNNNKTICNNDEIAAEISNKHFIQIVQNIDTDKILANNIGNPDITRPVFNAIKNQKFNEQ